ncbi:hypothetical protein [Bradyrhizobium sp. LVM 105]|uniref:hypothetical protein n=1 Tax=Bradyrhizobium sp. LVM 105 TaxID=2341115 RepID=UPI000F8130B2|nr:hypothetical protein [Bradyrhizobium sp. LVM 105]RTE92683.1 hypothetical protein D6B98_14380 [Bradyrhizobium sp. LVM 105]
MVSMLADFGMLPQKWGGWRWLIPCLRRTPADQVATMGGLTLRSSTIYGRISSVMQLARELWNDRDARLGGPVGDSGWRRA